MVPRNHGPNTTLIAAMSPAGVTAAMTLEGARDRAAFDVFVAEVLVPTVRPGQVVVWDNLSVHTSALAPRLIEAAGCRVVFLPPSSPDFAPVEQAFGTLKTFLLRTGPRSRDALDRAMTVGRETITAADARAWFAHCGYRAAGQPL